MQQRMSFFPELDHPLVLPGVLGVFTRAEEIEEADKEEIGVAAPRDVAISCC